jgi:hypothetical protein
MRHRFVPSTLTSARDAGGSSSTSVSRRASAPSPPPSTSHRLVSLAEMSEPSGGIHAPVLSSRSSTDLSHARLSVGRPHRVRLGASTPTVPDCFERCPRPQGRFEGVPDPAARVKPDEDRRAALAPVSDSHGDRSISAAAPQHSVTGTTDDRLPDTMRRRACRAGQRAGVTGRTAEGKTWRQRSQSASHP